MIRLKVVAKVQPEKRSEFLDAIHSLQKDRFKEHGLSGSQIYEYREESNRFILIDEWETDEDLQRYFSKQGFRILLGALRTLCTEAEVKYDPLRRAGGDITLYSFDTFSAFEYFSAYRKKI
jgi:quinol monooxygenase YgiN